MNAERCIAAMARFADTLPVLVRGLSDADLRWKPSTGAWSVLEVVCHLVDEEVEDFRARIKLMLERPGEPWPKIDPEGAAVERRYNEQDLGTQLARFGVERAESLRWLRSLRDVDWDTAYQHPRVGPVRAGVLLVSWPAHDLLHQRQITKRLFEIVQRDAGTYETLYAGEWKA